jgi:hypothetical protein
MEQNTSDVHFLLQFPAGLRNSQKTAAKINSHRAKNLQRHLQERKKFVNMATLDKKESRRNRSPSVFKGASAVSTTFYTQK